jgi:DNA-binding GntR family transcriptional regulator
MTVERLHLEAAGSRYRQARERMEIERQGLHDEIREAAGTMSEAEIARVTGVQRETVRKALGK